LLLQARFACARAAPQYEVLDDSPNSATSGPAASLLTLRLNPDELGVRPISVAGELGAVEVRAGAEGLGPARTRSGAACHLCRAAQR
jgi:hypothetical protein